jgi:hypothetical protein
MVESAPATISPTKFSMELGGTWKPRYSLRRRGHVQAQHLGPETAGQRGREVGHPGAVFGKIHGAQNLLDLGHDHASFFGFRTGMRKVPVPSAEEIIARRVFYVQFIEMDKPAVRAYMWGKSSLPCGPGKCFPWRQQKNQ